MSRLQLSSWRVLAWAEMEMLTVSRREASATVARLASRVASCTRLATNPPRQRWSLSENLVLSGTWCSIYDRAASRVCGGERSRC